MICLSLGHTDFDTLMEHLKHVALAEIRLDLLDLSPQRMVAVFGHHSNLIATCRTVAPADAYRQAIDMGAALIDVDIHTADSESIVNYAQRNGCQVIMSYHNFEHVPQRAELLEIVYAMQQRGANMAKLACMAQQPADAQTMLSLYDAAVDLPLIAFAMGQHGFKSRPLSVLLGAPFAYACLDGYATAPGQPTVAQLRRYLGF